MTQQELCQLIELHGKDLYGFCCYLTQSRYWADDLYQETFLYAAERLKDIDSSLNPKSFLISLAVGIWKNQRKKDARRQKLAPTVSMEEASWVNFSTSMQTDPEEALMTKEICQLVRTEMDSLKEKYRIPVYLYYAAEMSLEQIADVLHVPTGTVKSRLHKARKEIRKGLEEHGYEG